MKTWKIFADDTEGHSNLNNELGVKGDKMPSGGQKGPSVPLV